jgi:hypothetical protein
VAHELRASSVEEVESFSLERKERSMVLYGGHESDGRGRLRGRLVKLTGLALGIAMLGTIGLSGTLAQDDDVVAGGDAESIVNSIIQQVFAEIFGGGVVDDDATGSSGGDINVGGNMGGSVTMGGGSGGNINMGGSGGSVTMGDDSEG